MTTKTLRTTEGDCLRACGALFFELDGHASAISGLMSDAIEAMGTADEPDAHLLGRLMNLASSAQSITMLIGSIAGLGSAMAGGEGNHSQHSWFLSPTAVEAVDGALKSRNSAP